MIKYIQCVRRQPGMSVDDFRRHWSAYLSSWRELALAGLALRMTVSYGLMIEANAEIQQNRGTAPCFDAVLEVWLESGDLIKDMFGQAETAKLIKTIRDQQEGFIDLKNSSFFFAGEEESL